MLIVMALMTLLNFNVYLQKKFTQDLSVIARMVKDSP